MKAKTERNKLVVKLVDEKKWSFQRVADELGLKAKSTVHSIYHRTRSQLSTGDNLTRS